MAKTTEAARPFPLSEELVRDSSSEDEASDAGERDAATTNGAEGV